MKRWIPILLFGVTTGLVPVQTNAQDIASRIENLTLRALDGKIMKFKEVKSKVTIVALWASWCKPCIHELPYVNALYDRYRKDKQVSVIAINVDDQTMGLDVSSIKKLSKRLKLGMPMLMEPEQKLMGFLTTGKLDPSFDSHSMQLPLVTIIDVNGKAVQKLGFREDLSKQQFIEQYKKLINMALKGFNPGGISPPGGDLNQDLSRAMIKSAMGNQDQAEEILLGLLAKDPKDTRVMSTLSMIYEKMGKLDLSTRMLRGVLALKPESPQAMNDLAYLLARQAKNLDEAEKLARKALSKDPSNPSYMDTLGWIQYQKGQYKKALTKLEKANKLKPGVKEMLAHQAEVHMKLGQCKAAVELFRKALEASERSDATIIQMH